VIKQNLLSPAVMAFALSFAVGAIKGSLRLPQQVASFLSMYLLLAIGVKGGEALRASEPGDLWLPAVATLGLGVVTPLIAFVATRPLAMGTADRASMAAHYGSVSVVTFTAALAYVEAAGRAAEGFMPTLVALLEIPGIVVALVIAARSREGETKWGEVLHEVLTGKSIALLVGGGLIGAVATQESLDKTDPVLVGLFYGALVLFLLDLGGLAASKLGLLRQTGPKIVAVAILVPLVNGVLGAVAGAGAGLSTGGVTVLAVMAASASYIAAPAAVQIALPEADVAVALTASLAVTFPFNLVVGIPLFDQIAQQLT
jgi:uncharacterized protein